jgi:hypothetical protein
MPSLTSLGLYSRVEDNLTGTTIDPTKFAKKNLRY